MDPKPLSASFLSSRGSCCGSGCRNCPYLPRHTIGTIQQDEQWIGYSDGCPEAVYEDYLKSKNQS